MSWGWRHCQNLKREPNLDSVLLDFKTLYNPTVASKINGTLANKTIEKKFISNVKHCQVI